jgi:hypothetical protein
LSAFSVRASVERPDGTFLAADDLQRGKGPVTSSMGDRSVPDIRNRLVSFKVCDVYIPEPREILEELYANDILQGRVLDITDSGATKQAFAVVEVEGVGRHVIVPMQRILSVL